MQIAYKNPDGALIADRIFPTVKVDATTYMYNVYPEETFFSFPENTEVGRVNETPSITYKTEQKEASLKNHALQFELPRADKLTPEAFDYAANAVPLLNNGLDLGYEVKISRMIRDVNLYPATNKMTLAAADKVSNPASDPIKMFEDIINGSMLKFNTIIMGKDVLLELRRHPKVVQAVLGNANTSGRVTEADLLEMLRGVTTLLVGEGWVNIAAPGPNVAPEFVQCWEKDIILAYVNPLTTSTKDFTFGIKAQWKDGRELLHHFEPNMGPYGSDVIRVVYPHNPHVMAPKAGYLIKDAV
jgi:hypothetical protein